MLFQLVKIVTLSTVSLIPWMILACKLAAGVHMLNIMQKGAYKSWKFLQKHTKSLRSSKQLQSKSPAQFYSSSKKIMKPKRTIEFKKETPRKQWKTSIVTSLRTFSRVEELREPIPKVKDEEILAIVVKNSLPCKCVECHDVSEDGNHFEPMVFTHSTQMKMNKTFETVETDRRHSRNEGDEDALSTSSRSSEIILHQPDQSSWTGDRSRNASGDFEGSPILGKKVLKPDSTSLSSLQNLYKVEESKVCFENQYEDNENSSSSAQNENGNSSTQNENGNSSTPNVEAVDATNAEVDKDTNDIERRLSLKSSISNDFISFYGREQTTSSEEDDTSMGSQEADELNE